MKNLKARIASLAVGVLAVTSVAVVAPVVTAEPANAVTGYNCRVVDAGAGYLWYPRYSPGRYGAFIYYDYSWWEEVVLGKKDGTYLIGASNTWAGAYAFC